MGRAQRQADEESFRDFAAAHQRSLYRFALLATADRSLAEDLVQTALMRTFARWGRLRDQDPAAYARRIIVNANVDRWRRQRGREVLTDEPPDRGGDDVTADVDEHDAVLRALAALTDRERRVVVLRFLEDLTEADTSRLLGMPVGTVKSVTHRAVRKLRESTQLRGHDEVVP